MNPRTFSTYVKQSIKRSLLAGPLFAAQAWGRSPADQLAIFRDVRRTSRELRFIRDRGLPADPEKRVLVISNTDDVYPIKLELMLVTGLRETGWTPIVLLTRKALWAKSYFEAGGVRDFVYWEDYSISQSDRDKCFRDATQFMEGAWTFQEVKAWMYQDAWIGPQILSAISRKNYLGAPDVSDPEIRREISELLPRILCNVVQSARLIHHVRPTLATVNEANGPDMGPIVDMAIHFGTSVAQYVQPSRDDAVIFKRLNSQTRRIHPASASTHTLELLEKMEWNDEREKELAQEFDDRYSGKWFLQSRNQQHVKVESVDAVRVKLGVDPRKKVATVFSHVLWDANLFYGDDLFEDYGDWFVQTVKAACANPELNWLIKLHPANAWKRARDNADGELTETVLIREKIGELPAHVKLIFPTSEISTRALFDISDYAITVRGTAGVELPCFGVPTLTAGTGRYSGLGFTIDSETKEEYLRRLAHLQAQPPMKEAEILLAKKHAYALFRLRPWKMKSFKSVFTYPKRGRHPLDQNLFAQTDEFEKIVSNGDLRKWAEWAGRLESIDYLDDLPEGSVTK